jgi:hypothetical protein
MKYISFGVNCLPAMLFKNLYLKEETLPFDWCPTTLSVIAHCFKTNFEKFYNFDEKLNNPEINSELIKEYNSHKPNMKTNYYHNWFPHESTQANIEITLKRRVERLINYLNSDEEITFVFINECAIYNKIYLDKQDIYYNELLEICDILKNKYNKNNFKIISLFINKKFPDTEHLRNFNVIHNFTHDNGSGRTHWYSFRSEIAKIFKDILFNNSFPKTFNIDSNHNNPKMISNPPEFYKGIWVNGNT